MKIGKLVFGGAMASILMMGGAFAAVTNDSLTTKAYVDAGLTAAYNAAVTKAGTNADTKIQSALGTLGTVTDESGTRNMTVAEFVGKSLADAGLDPAGNVSESIEGLQSSVGTIGNLASGLGADLVSAVNAVNTKANSNASDIDTLEAAVEKLNGGDTVDGSVAKQIKDAITDDEGIIRTTVTNEVTTLIGVKEGNISGQLGYDVSKNPARADETGSLVNMLNMNRDAGGALKETGRVTSIVDAINANTASANSNAAAISSLSSTVSSIKVDDDAAGYVAVSGSVADGFTVGLANTPATSFSAGELFQ